MHPDPPDGLAKRPLAHAGVFIAIFVVVASFGLFPVQSSSAMIEPKLDMDQLAFPELVFSAPRAAPTELQAFPQPITVVAPEVANAVLLGANDLTDIEIAERALAVQNSSVDMVDESNAGRPRIAMYRNYEIQVGDTLSSIAEDFGLSLDDIVWNNHFLEHPDRVTPGVQLIVPYVPGIVHAVEFNETLIEIAEQYDVDMQDIIDFSANDITDPNQLKADEFIFVPGARVLPPPPSINPWESPIQPRYGGWYWPTAIQGRLTSYFDRWHPLGIDIGLPSGNEILASRAGVVTFAGGNPWVSYGYYVKIDHGDGWESLYAHLSDFAVGLRSGTYVYQGQVIGLSGNTGNSTGPHLHFETRLWGIPQDPLLQLR